jgi:hypothetical protein
MTLGAEVLVSGATSPHLVYALMACTGTTLTLPLLNTKKQQVANIFPFFALCVFYMVIFARKLKKLWWFLFSVI